MPKGQHRSIRSQGYYRLSPVTTPTNATYPTLSARPSSLQNYYGPIPTSSMPHQQTYSTHQSQTQPQYATGGPVQHPMSSHPTYVTMPTQQQQQQQHPTHQAAPPASIRPSSGAWNPTDDQTLMAARAQGMNWAPIQLSYFPSKTPNACRKRHERLMERRNADDWDGLKLENLSKNYMTMRREIWSGLASMTGEKWNVVEAKCMTLGLKNLQTSARSCARRERLLEHSPTHHSHPNSHTTSLDLDGTYATLDDSGIDLEAEYDADGASEHSGGSHGYGVYGGGGGHQREMSGASSAGSVGGSVGGGMGRYFEGGGRVSSMDMGIEAIINRPGGRR